MNGDPGIRQRRSNELREAAIRLRERGFTYSEIAEQLGITVNQAKAKARAADRRAVDGQSNE